MPIIRDQVSFSSLQLTPSREQIIPLISALGFPIYQKWEPEVFFSLYLNAFITLYTSFSLLWGKQDYKFCYELYCWAFSLLIHGFIVPLPLDRLAIIRSTNVHDELVCHTGWDHQQDQWIPTTLPPCTPMPSPQSVGLDLRAASFVIPGKNFLSWELKMKYLSTSLTKAFIWVYPAWYKSNLARIIKQLQTYP